MKKNLMKLKYINCLKNFKFQFVFLLIEIENFLSLFTINNLFVNKFFLIMTVFIKNLLQLYLKIKELIMVYLNKIIQLLIKYNLIVTVIKYLKSLINKLLATKFRVNFVIFIITLLSLKLNILTQVFSLNLLVCSNILFCLVFLNLFWLTQYLISIKRSKINWASWWPKRWIPTFKWIIYLISIGKIYSFIGELIPENFSIFNFIYSIVREGNWAEFFLGICIILVLTVSIIIFFYFFIKNIKNIYLQIISLSCLRAFLLLGVSIVLPEDWANYASATLNVSLFKLVFLDFFIVINFGNIISDIFAKINFGDIGYASLWLRKRVFLAVESNKISCIKNLFSDIFKEILSKIEFATLKYLAYHDCPRLNISDDTLVKKTLKEYNKEHIIDTISETEFTRTHLAERAIFHEYELKALLFIYDIAKNPNAVVMVKPDPSIDRIFPVPLSIMVMEPWKVGQNFLSTPEGKVCLYLERPRASEYTFTSDQCIMIDVQDKEEEVVLQRTYYEKYGEITPQYYENFHLTDTIRGEFIRASGKSVRYPWGYPGGLPADPKYNFKLVLKDYKYTFPFKVTVPGKLRKPEEINFTLSCLAKYSKVNRPFCMLYTIQSSQILNSLDWVNIEWKKSE